MKNILKLLRPAFLCFMIMTLICGVVYTGVVTGIAQVFFRDKANGSIITVTLNDGTKKDFGSSLLEQEFKDPKYLIGRPMGTTNLSPNSKGEENTVNERISFLKGLDPGNNAPIPIDLVTSSGSGVDPYISIEAAMYQVPRIARVRGMNENDVKSIIDKYTVNRFLGFIGEPGVNVLKVNLALDNLL
ncbi:MAG: potassium-transporting ATPase subunit C [Oscillospiraceae bacterium]|nr:potassium-transporting ATPase subunit C [Oscillospiraceae bacterium]